MIFPFKDISRRTTAPQNNISPVASHESLYGTVRSEWRRSPGHFELAVEIPPNTTATVWLPNRDNHPVSESGGALAQAEGVRYLGEKEGCTVAEIVSGTYRFEY
jgi:alpha-L-rhamnosidase